MSAQRNLQASMERPFEALFKLPRPSAWRVYDINNCEHLVSHLPRRAVPNTPLYSSVNLDKAIARIIKATLADPNSAKALLRLHELEIDAIYKEKHNVPTT